MQDIINAEDVAHIINTIKANIKLKAEYHPDRTVGIDVVQPDQHGLNRLAECIFEWYLKRTKRHIELVKTIASKLASLMPDSPYIEGLLKQVENHDSDKLNDLDFAANYAPYLVHKYGPQELTCNFDLTDEYKKKWDTIYVVEHCKNNKHHPEGWDETYNYGENNPPYTPRAMDEVSMLEMVCDWMAVGYEMGNTAVAWFDKTNGARWLWSNSQKTFIMNALQYEADIRKEIKGADYGKPGEVHFDTYEEAEAFLRDNYNGHGRIYLESTDECIRGCRCPSRIHESMNIPKVYTKTRRADTSTEAMAQNDNITLRFLPPAKQLSDADLKLLWKSDTEAAEVSGEDVLTFEKFKAWARSRNGKNVLIYAGSTPIGAVGYKISTKYENVKKSLWIVHFSIFKEQRRKGYGRASLIKLIQYFKKSDQFKDLPIFLGVTVYNKPALELYRSLGFEIVKKGKEQNVEFYHMRLKDNPYFLSAESLSVSKESYKPKSDKVSTESLETSTEAALPSNFKEKRKKIEKYILDSIKLLDPHTDINTKYWSNKFKSMSDKDFDYFMQCLKDHRTNIHMFAPPLKVHLKHDELIEAAHKLGVKLMHRIWVKDDATGQEYLTPEEYLVVQLPVRRQQQFLDEKISVPDNDKTIDGLTGQVTGDSKACAITNPEIHIMQARNLDASLHEFVNVRGGNIHNYAEFKRSLEETGTVSLNKLDPNNRTRVAVMAGVLLTGMHLESNINENI